MKSKIMIILCLLFCVISVEKAAYSAEKVIDDWQQRKIAKAVISAIMAKDPSIVRVENFTEHGVYLVSYVREQDKTFWSYLVKFNGKTAVWAGAGSSSEPNVIGRWRNHPADSVVTYEIENNIVVIRERFSEKSVVERRYEFDGL